MTDYCREGQIYNYRGFTCGKLSGDGCAKWIDDTVPVVFEGIYYKWGRLRAFYRFLKPHTCPHCGRVADSVSRNYDMDEYDMDELDREVEDALDRMSSERNRL